jgi:antibiotic biosynthesis monooxygenase (ABM) superfamily enzyme
MMNIFAIFAKSKQIAMSDKRKKIWKEVVRIMACTVVYFIVSILFSLLFGDKIDIWKMAESAVLFSILFEILCRILGLNNHR